MQKLCRRPKLLRAQYREAGIALPEAMIALVIIVIALTANAFALLSAYAAYGTADNNTKAYQLINQQFAVFKQAPWPKLGTTPQSVATAGCDAYSDPFNNEGVVPIALSASYGYTAATSPAPLQFCQGYQYASKGTSKPVLIYGADESRRTDAGLGITYYVQTMITSVGTNTFDNANATAQADNTTHYNARRVTVTVRWTENDSQGRTKNQLIRMSTVRAPTISECVPTGVKDSANNAVIAGGC